MKKILLTIFFLFLQAFPAYAQPSLHVDRPEFDFGTISQEDKAEHIFEIENRGDSDLIIEKLTPS